MNYLLREMDLGAWLGSYVTVRAFRVGGLRFVRVGKLQVSWCVVSGVKRERKRARVLQARNEGYNAGWCDCMVAGE